LKHLNMAVSELPLIDEPASTTSPGLKKTSKLIIAGVLFNIAMHSRHSEEIYETLGSTNVEIQWRWHLEDTHIPCVSKRIADMNPLRYSKPMSLEEAVENIRQRRSQVRRLCCDIRSVTPTCKCCEQLTLDFATPAHAVAKLNDLLRCQQWMMTHQRPDHDLVSGLGLPMWSKNNSHDLGLISDDEARSLIICLCRSATFIDHLTSVTAAVDALNSRKVQCNDGYCIVYSQRRDTCFLIWRSDVEKQVIEMFALRKDFEGAN